MGEKQSGSALQIISAGRTVSIYTDAVSATEAPLVFMLAGDEDGARVWKLAREQTAQPFALAAIPVSDWNRELSPWATKGVFKGGEDFGGGADALLRKLEREIVPAVRAELHSVALCILAGYLLAGLCAVYAFYRTQAFSRVISASDSLWFPGFYDVSYKESDAIVYYSDPIEPTNTLELKLSFSVMRLLNSEFGRTPKNLYCIFVKKSV